MLKRVSAILLLFILALVAAPHLYAWNNDYKSSSNYESYSQSWQSYKEQNNIKTETAYVQQSWYQKLGGWLYNAADTMGRAIINFAVKVYDVTKNFIVNIYNKLTGTPAITQTPNIKDSTINTKNIEEKFVPYENRLSGNDVPRWQKYKNEQLSRDPQAQKQAKDKTYAPASQLPYETKERLWFNQFINLRDDVKAQYVLPTANEQAVLDWQTFALPENTDKVEFFDLFAPGSKVNGSMAIDRINQDFTPYRNMNLANQQLVDGSLDIARRAGTYAATKAAGSTASDLAKTAGMDQVGQFMASKTASEIAKDALPKTNVMVNAADWAIFKDIAKNINTIGTMDITSFTYKQNILGVTEADKLNRDQKLGPYAAGVAVGTTVGAYSGNAMMGVKAGSTTVSVINTINRQQPFAAGQVVYKALIGYNDNRHPLYNKWQVELNYRVGDYTNRTGKSDHGVIEL
jgi:hypothetical protein